MTKQIWIRSMTVAAVSALMGVGIAMADEPTTPAPTGAAPTAQAGGDKHPCKELRASALDACGKAGYIKGKHKEGKGLYKDCIEPIMHGKSVAGVTVDSSLVQACEAKHASKK